VSRIGKKAIPLPAGVSAAVSGHVVSVKGAKGELSLSLLDGISARIEGSDLLLERSSEAGQVRARHGLLRALAGNMVTGVSTGFTKRLEVQGVGFRAEVKGKSLVMNLGYSHQIDFPVPDDVAIAVEKDGKIAVSGIDRARVGQVAADIRSFRKPDRYKGKGVRYVGEHIALKEGKSS
jgi:large subunit ribosomal protein L6